MNPRISNHHSSVGSRPDRLPRPAIKVGKAGHVEEPPDTQTGGFSSILRSYPVTLGITVLTALLLITVSALILYNSPDPTALIPPVSAAVLAVAALIGGIIAGKLNPSSPVPASLICGGLTAALLILVSLFAGGGGDFLTWGIRIGILPLHLLGGILTRPKTKLPTHTAGNHPSRR